MIRMKAPQGASFVSHGGQTYQVIDGHVDVPDDAARALFAHGYSIAAAEAATAQAEDPAKAKSKPKAKAEAPIEAPTDEA